MREGVVLVALALALAVLIRSFLVQAFFVPSESMEPTLDINDRILVSKLTTDIHGVKRGQVIVFKDPGGWLEPQADNSATWQRWLRNGMTYVGLLPADRGDDLVKRVIGVGGDHVVCCDSKGRITVNGKALDEPYIAAGAKPSDSKFDVHEPDGHLWVMGDNRPFSEDSRPHEAQRPGGGMVPVGNVVGRVVLVVYPIGHWARLAVPATFHDIPDGSP
jgi:signal peptidase I